MRRFPAKTLRAQKSKVKSSKHNAYYLKSHASNSSFQFSKFHLEDSLFNIQHLTFNILSFIIFSSISKIPAGDSILSQDIFLPLLQSRNKKKQCCECRCLRNQGVDGGLHGRG